jgi:alanyl-tRNA synthetase
MSKDAAIASGAVAMFGEKYGEQVRVVSVGDYAIELCGGTHVDHAGAIHLLKITSEAGVASGIRRIVAYTQAGALQLLNERYEESRWLRERLKASTHADVEQRIERMFASEKELRKQIDELKFDAMKQEISQLMNKKVSIGGWDVLIHEMPTSADGVKTLRDAGEELKSRSPRAIILLAMTQPEVAKVFVLAACGKEAVSVVDASQLIREIAPLLDARGGGKVDMAQAGGSNIGSLPKALLSAREFIERHCQ